MRRYGYEFANKYLIATFPALHYAIEDYPAVRDYLLSACWSEEVPDGYGKEKLEQTGKKHTIADKEFTARKRTSNKWFETQDQIGYWEDFSRQKIVWSDLMRITKNESSEFPRFALLEEEFLLSNTAYFIVGTDIDWLLDALNSEVAAYFFLQYVTTFDNGGLRMFRQFIEDFPAPRKKHGLSVAEMYGFSAEERQYITDFVSNRIAEIQSR